jgi:glycosyltransferase involved in cell wall biosynthesis
MTTRRLARPMESWLQHRAPDTGRGAPAPAASIACAREPRIAYVSRVTYPDRSANALQTMHMADAFARRTGDTALFVHDLVGAEQQIRAQYGLASSPLRICRLRTQRWPAAIYESRARFLAYNSAVGAMVSLQRHWRGRRRRNVLFVRSRLETLYWGRARPYLPWLKDWVMVCELHDLQIPVHLADPDRYDRDSRAAGRLIKALREYDVVLAVTEGLARDVQALTDGAVVPVVIPMSSGLPRTTAPTPRDLSKGAVTVGYVGGINAAHGVDELIQAAALLPKHWTVRLTGTLRPVDRPWIERAIARAGVGGQVTIAPPVHYRRAAEAIDDSDIAVAPAGETRHSCRYRSPLKLFDYMARGKPIVAAGVPAHLEVLKDEWNALIYRPRTPSHLAACVQAIVASARLAHSIATRAWEQSAAFTYDARAARILEQIAAIPPRT